MSSGVDGAEYWNHNSAYHPWILRQIDGRFGLAALDVGCGEGLLLQRLSPYCTTLVGIDPDPSSIARAHRRLPQATLLTQLFDDLPTDQSFDLITMVASLHHMELEPTLHKVHQLLRPGGQFLVVGLSARKSVADWVISALSVPVASIGSGCRWPSLGKAWQRSERPPQRFCPARGSDEACTTGIYCRTGSLPSGFLE